MGMYPSSLSVANGNSGKLKKEKRGKKKTNTETQKPAGCLRGFVIQCRDFHF